jgi:hypothetical protein
MHLEMSIHAHSPESLASVLGGSYTVVVSLRSSAPEPQPLA